MHHPHTRLHRASVAGWPGGAQRPPAGEREGARSPARSSPSTSATGQRQGVQYVDAWGKKLSGSVSQTKRSYTGQYLDDTGLLFYNARYYDPGIGRFVSADSIVPGNASGGMAGIAYKPLTVDVHEPGFVAKIAQENQFGPWYSLSDKEKQQLGAPWGPANPQALNRYSYVLNNPMKWTDPGGHTLYLNATETSQLVAMLESLANDFNFAATIAEAGDVATAAAYVRDKIAALLAAGETGAWVAGLLGAAVVAVLGYGTVLLEAAAYKLNWLKGQIAYYSAGGQGIAIATNGTGGVYLLDRRTGDSVYWDALGGWDIIGATIIRSLPQTTRISAGPQGDPYWYQGYHFSWDEALSRH